MLNNTISLIGMAGAGKSYWSKKLEQHGFRRFCCDDLIKDKINNQLKTQNVNVTGVGEWMGFPYESKYKANEAIYLYFEFEVLREILDWLEIHERSLKGNIVIDTTGSVIYAGKEILRRLQVYTTIIYLPVSYEIHEKLLRDYISRPHPMVWKGMFKKEKHETNKEVFARCYPKLLNAREKLYERYADKAISYYKRSKKDFGVNDFLNEIGAILKPAECG